MIPIINSIKSAAGRKDDNDKLRFDLLSPEFEEAVAVVYTALINELPEINFNGYIGYMCGAYDFGYCFEKKDNELYTSISAGDGNGCCPECGEVIAHLDEFDPNKTYICPDCREEIPNYYLFDEYRNEEHTYEIINGELVEK